MDAGKTWLHLLIRLEHMLMETQRPAATKLFNAQGSRRLKVAQKQLLKEHQELLRIGQRWGLSVAAGEVREAACGLPLSDDLKDDYLALAEGYRGAAIVAERLGDPSAAQWLRTRANIHDLQRFLLKS